MSQRRIQGRQKQVVALMVSETVTGRKEKEKVAVTRERCFKCGNMGHKAAECMVHMVGEIGLEGDKPIGEVAEEPRWVAAGVTQV